MDARRTSAIANAMGASLREKIPARLARAGASRQMQLWISGWGRRSSLLVDYAASAVGSSFAASGRRILAKWATMDVLFGRIRDIVRR
jgi:hypothetical protein